MTVLNGYSNISVIQTRDDYFILDTVEGLLFKYIEGSNDLTLVMDRNELELVFELTGKPLYRDIKIMYDAAMDQVYFVSKKLGGDIRYKTYKLGPNQKNSTTHRVIGPKKKVTSLGFNSFTMVKLLLPTFRVYTRSRNVIYLAYQ